MLRGKNGGQTTDQQFFISSEDSFVFMGALGIAMNTGVDTFDG